MRRLAAGGRIDRSAALGLSFDGRQLAAHPGDTLASALLANGVAWSGAASSTTARAACSPPAPRSRTRSSPSARARRRRRTPARPCRRPSTGSRPSARTAGPRSASTLLAVNDLLAPLLGAGFYYKTFMWPRAFWERLYEPRSAARRASGGCPARADPDRCEKAFAFCDLLVIGAGPAGLMAALTAGRAGARVILADEDFLPRRAAQRRAARGRRPARRRLGGGDGGRARHACRTCG